MDSCLILAGEKSGEEHTMSFFPRLKELCPDVAFYGVGGDELEKAGVEVIYHLKDFSSMGFSEVIGKIPFYFKAMHKLVDEAKRRNTKTAILVDFQDFNLRLAGKLSKAGVRVLYYVAPQAWAWKAHRAGKLANAAHTLFTILPFEKKWFGDRGVKQIKAIPHPLIHHYQKELHHLPAKPFTEMQQKLKLLLLPGSRNFEVQNLLPEFIKVAQLLKSTRPIEVHLVKVGHINPSLYEMYRHQVDYVHTSEDLTKVMRQCHLALAASGTVTLSTGLFEIPTVVAYKVSLLNQFVFRNFIKYQGPISLTNIIHGENLFPELTQEEANAYSIERALRPWLESEAAYNDVKEKLKATKALLTGDSFSIPQYMSEVIHGK